MIITYTSITFIFMVGYRKMYLIIKQILTQTMLYYY